MAIYIEHVYQSLHMVLTFFQAHICVEFFHSTRSISEGNQSYAFFLPANLPSFSLTFNPKQLHWCFSYGISFLLPFSPFFNNLPSICILICQAILFPFFTSLLLFCLFSRKIKLRLLLILLQPFQFRSVCRQSYQWNKLLCLVLATPAFNPDQNSSQLYKTSEQCVC